MLMRLVLMRLMLTRLMLQVSIQLHSVSGFHNAASLWRVAGFCGSQYCYHYQYQVPVLLSRTYYKPSKR